MIVTHKISADFSRRGAAPWVDAVQDDKYCRNLEITLYADGVAWKPPGNAVVMVRYVKADGTGGEYNTLPDGSVAYSIDSNVVTVALAPQVLTAAGPVRLNIGIFTGDREISTFEILINVQANVGARIAGSRNYFNVSGFLARSGWAENMYLGTDENGNVIAVEAPECDGTGGADVEEVLEQLPVTVSEDGYTDITGLRQMTGFAVVRDGQTVTLTINLQGGMTNTHVITLDDYDYPVKIVSDGVEATGTWEGFDG